MTARQAGAGALVVLAGWLVAGPAAGFAQEGRRDPFVPLVRGGRFVTATKAATGIEGVVLEGVLWDPDRPIAIINGELVGEGEIIDGFLVKQIGVDRVVLKAGDKEHTIPLIQEAVLKEGPHHAR